MANSMDTILVKYGAKGIDVEYDHSDHPEVKTVTLPEFLKIPPEQLSGDERKIQDAASKIYELNEKEPPLYKNLVNQNPQRPPLTINCTGKYNVPGAAVFVGEKNEIGFISKDDNLVGSLAHELQHAEQHAQLEIQKILDGNDNQAKREVFLMDEAEAFFTGARACVEIFHKAESGIMAAQETYLELCQKYTLPDGKPDISTIKQKMMTHFMRRLSDKNMMVYPFQLEMIYPLRPTDIGLQHVPEHYGLTDDFRQTFKQLPHEPQFDAGKIRQHFANHQEDQILPTIKEALSKNPDLAVYTKNRILSSFFDDFYVDKDKDKKMLDTLIHLKDENGKEIFDKKTVVDVLTDSVHKGKGGFTADIKIIQGENKNLPFTSEDFIGEYQPNTLLRKLSPYSEEGRAQIAEMFPVLLQLKGSNGKPIVKTEDAIKSLIEWCNAIENPKDIQALFDAIKDEKGNLPFPRKIFDTNEGESVLLEELRFTFLPKGNPIEKLPILMALKDKDGKPIISQENIDKFPKYSDLASAVKAYKQVNIKQHLKAQSKSGGKKLEQNPEGYVKKGQKSAPSSATRRNPAKGDLSL